MTTAVEVDQRLQRNLGTNVLLSFRSLELFGCGIVAVDVGLVVVLVVKLHDLARDGGLQGAIVI